ncbi:MAG: hypothetical protein HQL48_07215 [Gammaproteobacteria bacterium]|nr:hypothetical protein [Gammaproteobacteria bacterium]
MKRLLIFGCKTMREGVLASSVFFFGAVAMLTAATYLVPDIGFFRHIFLLIGLVLMLFAPAILISTFLLTVLFARKEIESECEH